MDQNSNDQFKHFPLNDSGDSTKDDSNELGVNQKNDDLVLFPLEQNKNLVQKNSAPHTIKPVQVISNKRKKSSTTTKSSNQSTNRSFVLPKAKPNYPLNPTNNKRQQSKKSYSFFKIFIFAILFYFFKERILQISSINKLSKWVIEHNPFGKNLKDFEEFKKDKIILYAENPNLNPIFRFKNTMTKVSTYSNELILIGKTWELRRRYLLPKGVKVKMSKSNKSISNSSDWKMISSKDKITNSKIFINEMGDTNIDYMIRNRDLEKSVMLQEWGGGPSFSVRLKNIEYYDEIGVSYINNDFESFKKFDSGVIFLPTFIYNKLLNNKNVKGFTLKNIPTKSIRGLVR